MNFLYITFSFVTLHCEYLIHDKHFKNETKNFQCECVSVHDTVLHFTSRIIPNVIFFSNFVNPIYYCLRIFSTIDFWSKEIRLCGHDKFKQPILLHTILPSLVDSSLDVETTHGHCVHSL